jgi:hypothetical protein
MVVNTKESNSREPKADSPASAACTRSGAFSLGLSLALLCLIPYWQHRPAELALADYLDSRTVLTMNLDQLEQDPAWNYYKDTNQEAESIGLGRLPSLFTFPPPEWRPSSGSPLRKPPNNFGIGADQNGPMHQASASLVSRLGLAMPRIYGEQETAQVPPSNSPNAPPPPGGLSGSIVGPIPELNGILLLTKKLNNPEAVKKASNYSVFYSVSISRWVQKKRMLAWHDQL